MDKKYDHSIEEQKVRALWQEEKTYKAENNPGKSFTIDTPPPPLRALCILAMYFLIPKQIF